jgi:hypothetical protein
MTSNIIRHVYAGAANIIVALCMWGTLDKLSTQMRTVASGSILFFSCIALVGEGIICAIESSGADLNRISVLTCFAVVGLNGLIEPCVFPKKSRTWIATLGFAYLVAALVSYPSVVSCLAGITGVLISLVYTFPLNDPEAYETNYDKGVSMMIHLTCRNGCI